MEEELIPEAIFFIGRIILAVILGGIIGLEREYKGHEAGVRTFGFISMGSCIFGLLSIYAGQGDPTRIAAQIVTGVGFLGGGLIVKDGMTVRGLTTAAVVWCSSAIGLAVGFGFYLISILTTIISLVLLSIPHLGARFRSKNN